MFTRIFTLFMARNREYFRDKSALGWNFIFPFLIIAGFGVIFTGNSRDVYKIAVVQGVSPSSATSSVNSTDPYPSPHPEFKPELTPKEMLELGIFGGKYMTDCEDEFSKSWFKKAKFSPDKKDISLNFFKVDASLSLKEWERKTSRYTKS